MSLDKPLSEADERDLLSALRVKGREAEKLTRGQATEVRHTLLYVSQDMMQLRDYVVGDAMRWTTAAAELEDLIGRLETLREYIDPARRLLIWNDSEIGGANPAPGAIIAEVNTMRSEP